LFELLELPRNIIRCRSVVWNKKRYLGLASSSIGVLYRNANALWRIDHKRNQAEPIRSREEMEIEKRRMEMVEAKRMEIELEANREKRSQKNAERSAGQVYEANVQPHAIECHMLLLNVGTRDLRTCALAQSPFDVAGWAVQACCVQPMESERKRISAKHYLLCFSSAYCMVGDSPSATLIAEQVELAVRTNGSASRLLRGVRPIVPIPRYNPGRICSGLC
jgi:hypothetical protein